MLRIQEAASACLEGIALIQLMTSYPFPTRVKNIKSPQENTLQEGVKERHSIPGHLWLLPACLLISSFRIFERGPSSIAKKDNWLKNKNSSNNNPRLLCAWCMPCLVSTLSIHYPRSKKNVYHSHFTNKEAEMQLYVISPKVLKIANDRVGLHPLIRHSGGDWIWGTDFKLKTFMS